MKILKIDAAIKILAYLIAYGMILSVVPRNFRIGSRKANVPIMKIIPSKRPLYKAVLATFLASSLFPRPSSLEIYEPAPLPNNSPNPTIT